jgi:glycosyltransferase involved in cell wall biosynthesis
MKAEVEQVGATIHSIPIRSPGFAARFSSLLSKKQYDAVQSAPNLVSGVILSLAHWHRVPIRIANIRNMLGDRGRLMSNPLFMWLMWSLIKHSATHVVAVSRAALDDTFPPPWQTSCDCRVIYNGRSLAPFQGPVERRQVRDEFGWPLDSRVVINVARFSRQKNHPTILEAARLAYERHRDIRLLLVGDGELRDEITKLVDDHGLKDMCVMAGLHTDVPRLLLASDVFFFPSLWEGLPGALLEALAAGLPVVTSDIPPIQEIAEHSPASIILVGPANDAEQHTEHILTALDASIDQAAAREHFAKTPFTLENSVSAYSVLYGLDQRIQ